ncbi:hypothetical protein KIPB_002443 [Kipferlia bialata]|uniref:Uncharacterized protein n=1 Tax=Kipferlia bialata TaxID=797122 RepID=A0A9K3GG88_9EUKA|nr:hypothetical protein KIPB_002443 [Kipferlia bialata]|eukprot:g2443.t1
MSGPSLRRVDAGRERERERETERETNSHAIKSSSYGIKVPGRRGMFLQPPEIAVPLRISVRGKGDVERELSEGGRPMGQSGPVLSSRGSARGDGERLGFTSMQTRREKERGGHIMSARSSKGGWERTRERERESASSAASRETAEDGSSSARGKTLELSGLIHISPPPSSIKAVPSPSAPMSSLTETDREQYLYRRGEEVVGEVGSPRGEEGSPRVPMNTPSRREEDKGVERERETTTDFDYAVEMGEFTGGAVEYDEEREREREREREATSNTLADMDIMFGGEGEAEGEAEREEEEEPYSVYETIEARPVEGVEEEPSMEIDEWEGKGESEEERVGEGDGESGMEVDDVVVSPKSPSPSVLPGPERESPTSGVYLAGPADVWCPSPDKNPSPLTGSRSSPVSAGSVSPTRPQREAEAEAEAEAEREAERENVCSVSEVSSPSSQPALPYVAPVSSLPERERDLVPQDSVPSVTSPLTLSGLDVQVPTVSFAPSVPSPSLDALESPLSQQSPLGLLSLLSSSMPYSAPREGVPASSGYGAQIEAPEVMTGDVSMTSSVPETQGETANGDWYPSLSQIVSEPTTVTLDRIRERIQAQMSGQVMPGNPDLSMSSVAEPLAPVAQDMGMPDMEREVYTGRRDRHVKGQVEQMRDRERQALSAGAPDSYSPTLSSPAAAPLSSPAFVSGQVSSPSLLMEMLPTPQGQRDPERSSGEAREWASPKRVAGSGFSDDSLIEESSDLDSPVCMGLNTPTGVSTKRPASTISPREEAEVILVQVPSLAARRAAQSASGDTDMVRSPTGRVVRPITISMGPRTPEPVIKRSPQK